MENKLLGRQQTGRSVPPLIDAILGTAPRPVWRIYLVTQNRRETSTDYWYIKCCADNSHRW